MRENPRPARTRAVLELTDRADSLRVWSADIVRHFDVLMVLARKDFQTRYKRATLGVAWAVVVPLVQATVMAVVFSHVVRTGAGRGYGIYVLSGIIPFTYFSSVLTNAVTSIVDGSGLTEKVWFPRVLLVVVPAVSNLVGLVITVALLVLLMPLLGVGYGPRDLLLLPAVALLVAFTVALSTVLAALYVYFRDVKFLVQAALMVWVYITPVVYRIGLLHHLEGLVEANPLTGVVTVFHLATVGGSGPVAVPVAVTVGVTLILLAAGVEAQRRHDRLFVDLL